MLNIDMEFKKGVLFVRLNGILNEETSLILDEDLTSIIKNNLIKNVSINLKHVSYIDKEGIDVIRKNYHIIKELNGKLMICGLKKLIFNKHKLAITN